MTTKRLNPSSGLGRSLTALFGVAYPSSRTGHFLENTLFKRRKISGRFSEMP